MNQIIEQPSGLECKQHVLERYAPLTHQELVLFSIPIDLFHHLIIAQSVPNVIIIVFLNGRCPYFPHVRARPVDRGDLSGGVVGVGGCGDGAGSTCHLGSQAPFSLNKSGTIFTAY
ncbi:MAG: hypothetical protein Q8R42_00205 [Desulfocapsaceae bacterium]|nr:hypothetical protein [Desulfocapsaceae bacterium]